ncbi:MAG TPA: agmatinase family protein [Bacteroidales bacterium]|nr:agmatinase family protein [Bacteroidales bacterium]HRZ48333.1 agmatinase family protein [Bacteroidales bacterium]
MSFSSFDASGVGIHNGNYFGFPWTPAESEIVIVNVPWDATTSYRRGTAAGPEAMVQASTQLDFYSFDVPGSGIIQIGTDRTMEADITTLNHRAGALSAEVIRQLESGADPTDPALSESAHQVNRLSEELDQMVYRRCQYWLQKGKQVIVAGGEHSVPLGFIRALTETCPSFGILQFDAHADLRDAYEGFLQSHASIMFNVMQQGLAEKLVQVGIRDVSEPEMKLAAKDPRISVFSDFDLHQYRFAGGSWFEQCRDIVSCLPEQVYISFDIDGLDPSLCPNTGTPVPGGLILDEAMYLIRMVAESGRKIIGADLCEVAPGTGDWDSSVGARVLYRMACLMHHTHYPTTA